MEELIGGRVTDTSIMRRHYIPHGEEQVLNNLALPKSEAQKIKDAPVVEAERLSQESERAKVENSFQSKALRKFFKNSSYFDAHEIAYAIYAAQVINLVEQPEWRRKLLKKFGPTGTKIDGYENVSQCFLWEWDAKKLGRITIDRERNLIFDGSNFMVKYKKEDGSSSRHSISLENWLIAEIKKKDASVLLDDKWKFKTLWFELMKIMQVR